MNDLRFALRQLLKEPRFTIAAVLALAIGIGANTAIFSVIDAVLLKPLPFPKAEQLVAWGSIDSRVPKQEGLRSVSYPDFFDFRKENRSFAKMAIYQERSLSLSGDGMAQSLRAMSVSGAFFDVLGVQPLLGRVFTQANEKAGGGPGGLGVVLSHAFWQKQFGANKSVLGTSIRLNGQLYTIIGIMPAGFVYPLDDDPTDVFVSSAIDAVNADGSKPVTTQRGSHMLTGIGRLKPGVTAAAASTELKTLAAALTRQYPDTNTHFSAGAEPLREDLVSGVSRGLYVLFAAVICVLLIASANVANLLLARATVRRKEIALRAALGASRGRIFRQLLTESVLLAVVGGVCGLLLAVWGTEILVSLVPDNIPRAQNISLNAVVLAFTFLASLGTGIIFGLAPALQSSRLDLREALNEGARGSSSGQHRSLRHTLVVLEVALALLLLTGAGLLLRSFARLSEVNPGVQPEHLFTAGISLSDSAYPTTEKLIQFQRQLLEGIRALPEVREASTVAPLPLSGSNFATSVNLEERPKPEGQQDSAPFRIAGSNYFQTMGIGLLRGRLFNDLDRADSKPVVIVNERFVEHFFPGENPIGKRIQPGLSVTEGDGPMREIIGVVANVKHQSLEKDFTPEMYVPAAQFPFSFFTLVVRSNTSDPATLTNSVRTVLSRVDPDVPLARVKMFDDYLGRSLARPRFNALLLSIFAGVALVLTAIGIYGVMAYNVAQRRQEIGIRMALGAQKSDVLRMVVGGGMKLTALGVLIGIVATLGLTRLLGTLLYGVGSFDGLTFAAVALILAAIALLACWLPARRAAGTNPMIALRAE